MTEHTYKLLDMHYDANECDLLLFHSLRYQIVLEQVRVVDI